MREFTIGARTFSFRWSSDQEFDGLRLEAWEGEANVLDVSVPVDGPITVNTFSNEAPGALIEAALQIARQDRQNQRES